MTLAINRFKISANSFIGCLLLSENVLAAVSSTASRLIDYLKSFMRFSWYSSRACLFLLTLFTFMVVDDTLNHRDCSSETDASEAADTDVYKNCANHDCLHSLLPPLVKKIIVVISCKVRFSRCLTAKRLAIMNLLQIVKATGDAFIARAVESVKLMLARP